MGTAKDSFLKELNTFIRERGIPHGEAEQNSVFDQLIEKLVSERGMAYVSVTQCPTYQQVKALDPRTTVALLFYVASGAAALGRELEGENTVWGTDIRLQFRGIYEGLLFSLLRSNIDFEEADMVSLLKFFRRHRGRSYHHNFASWPVPQTVAQLERYSIKNGLSSQMRQFIMDALSWPEFDEEPGYYGSVQKAKMKLQVIFNTSGNGILTPPPLNLIENDVLGKYVNKSLDGVDDQTRERAYELFHLALSATGSIPTNKFNASSKEITARANRTKLKSCIQDWLLHLVNSRPIQQSRPFDIDGREYVWISSTFLAERNAVIIKGIIWAIRDLQDDKTIETVARLAERSFEKIPGQGPTCASVGNACIYYLANCKGSRGISHLSRLKLKIGQNKARELINRYIQEQSLKRGISSAELEERSVPGFGLVLGKLEESFDDFTVKLSLIGVGKTDITWVTSEGKPQKSTPAFVKNNKKLSDKLKKLKNLAKQIERYSTAQRDLIDRAYIGDREWTYEDFRKYYLDHGLVSVISRRTIWILINNKVKVSAIWHNEKWEDVSGNEVSFKEGSTTVRLWHPLLADSDQVMHWRDRLKDLGISQPMKQAHREVYILTDAELATQTYSNRMAAHLLKQHQFNALTGIRGWKYKLLGNYDDGREGETAKLRLPAHKMMAEYWVNEIYSDHAFNDAGIWDYVSTDQVRFVNESSEALNLVDIPKVVFSEVMRDVDLFVSVSSVGNDPQWLDRGGIATYRDYWISYSFGDLTEVAKTRKSVLEQMLPRLKIREQASIEGQFLRVKGKIREYKIHIGSTNILMEPNNQYLCIVPARTGETIADRVFLPFEGDRGLSLLLSKAVLLADDYKITDPTIVRQISNA